MDFSAKIGGEPVTTPTRWARVIDGADWQLSLGELAKSYYSCAYVWWRRTGLDAPEAAAATVAAFTSWLTRARPQRSDPGAERMREWMPRRLAALAAQGLAIPDFAGIEIDEDWAEARYAIEPDGDPDAIFQRRWALTVLEFAVNTLRTEYAARGEEKLFPELLPFAGFEVSGDNRYAVAAGRLGWTSGAVRKAVYEFRKRQRELLLAFAADTVADRDNAESEITALLCACDAVGPEAGVAPLPSGIRGVRPDEVFARAMQSVNMTAGQAGWEPPTVEEAARLFAQYEIVAILGRGGMGAVYKGRQPALDRWVAIKLLPLEVSSDAVFVDRFRREALAMARLEHPNIIAVHDFGTSPEGHLFIVMEFVDGANLDQMIHGPGLDPAQALNIITAVCDALAYAHENGVVHRDIKPANVLVSVKGRVKVADFGLARLADASAQFGHTSTGAILGTPDYMAPEQTRGMNVDHRADIYSLGVMLYEMLCREIPRGVFDPPSARAGVDARIDQVVVKAMQQQPDRRFQSATEMKTAVGELQAPAPKPIRSKGRLVAGAATVAVLATAGWIILSGGKASTDGQMEGIRGGQALASPLNGPSPVTAPPPPPFENTLGMKFVRVPIKGGPTDGRSLYFCMWVTRVQDYEVFVRETKNVWPMPEFKQGPTHPAINVSWEDARRFCAWLTQRERAVGRIAADQAYRLPSDQEWSCAVGLAGLEDASDPPIEKGRHNRTLFPWGTGWPPPAFTANYASEELKPLLTIGSFRGIKTVNAGYHDGYPATSPVGSYAPNQFGLFDMGGNVWQWCEDWHGPDQKGRVLRGASWDTYGPTFAVSSFRFRLSQTDRFHINGFRCVLGASIE